MVIHNVTFSTGNSKIGKTANVSFPPGTSCGADVPCKSQCYAQKAFKVYPAARLAWETNLLVYRTSADLFWSAVDAFLAIWKPAKFRIHVAGDFPDQACVDGWYAIARKHPDVDFLAFTKRFDLTFEQYGLTPNMSIVYSMWPGFGDPSVPRPKAWMRDAKNPDPRIPSDALTCSGHCDQDCFLCWNLLPNESVVFDRH